MTMRQSWRGVPRERSGFALIIVLWAFVLISLIVIHLTASGRTELRIAGNLAANAAAQAATDGAIYQAIFNLLDPQKEDRWPLDGGTHEIQVANSRVTVRLDDEAARINPNTASPALVEALLDVVAGNREQAATIALAIGGWIGVRTGSRPLTGINPDYQAAGLDYGPPGEPLESIEELGRVRGMTPDLLKALRPHLTLFGPAVPDAATADPVVAAALAEAAKTSPAPALPLSPAGNPGVLTARISATVQGPGNAAATRFAVARLGPGVPHGYVILAWEHNAD
jgi:general secretion pathway protein K